MIFQQLSLSYNTSVSGDHHVTTWADDIDCTDRHTVLRTNMSCFISPLLCFALFVTCAGVKYVRGGEVFEMRDEDNIQLNDPFKWVQNSVGMLTIWCSWCVAKWLRSPMITYTIRCQSSEFHWRKLIYSNLRTPFAHSITVLFFLFFFWRFARQRRHTLPSWS